MPYRGGSDQQVLNLHSVDGDTIEHFELDGSLDALLTSGRFRAIPIPGSTTRTGCNSNASSGERIATNPGQTQLAPTEVTIACLLWTDRIAGASARDVFRFGPIDGGLGEANNIQYRIELNPSSGAVTVAHENGASNFNSTTLSIQVPAKQWVHFVYTRNAAGTGGHIYVNSNREAWSLANAPTGGANGQFCLGNRFNGTQCPHNFSSVIFKSIEASEAQVAAMRQEVGL